MPVRTGHESDEAKPGDTERQVVYRVQDQLKRTKRSAAA